jgi:hypothetical protein
MSDDVEQRVECLVYSRVVGYLTSVQHWNAGKQQEFAERVTFRQPAEDAQDAADGEEAEAL